MSVTLRDLEEVLELQADLHARMLIAAAGKREAIIAGDLPKLEKLLALEHKLLSEVEAAEDKRLSLVEVARQELDLDDQPVKLAVIIESAAEPFASRLAHVRERLCNILDELRYRTRQNGELLQAGIEHVQGFLHAVAEATRPQAGYGPDGRLAGFGSFRLLDKSA